MDIDLEKLKVKEVMSSSLGVCGPEEEIARAAHQMVKQKTHHLLVVKEGEKPRLLTSFDLLHVVFLESYSGSLDFIKGRVDQLVKEQELVMVSPETSVKAALEICTSRGIRTLPVFEGDKPVGSFGVIDFVRHLLR